MADTQETIGVAIIRSAVGAASVLGLLASSCITCWALLSDWSRVPIVVMVIGWIVLLGAPIGYALMANFCWRSWKLVRQREGAGACYTVTAVGIGVALIGTVPSVILAWQMVLVATSQFFGFWMLWGFALASGIRKWRRMKRAANAE